MVQDHGGDERNFSPTFPKRLPTTTEIASNRSRATRSTTGPSCPTSRFPQSFGSEEEYRQRISEKELFDEFTLRRERQCRSESRRMAEAENQEARRLRQALPHKIRGRLSGQARLWTGRRSATATLSTAELARADKVRAAHYEDDGFPGLLPHRAGFHQRRPRETRRQRSDRAVDRLPEAAVAYCLGITQIDPVAIRPSVRAFPQPRPYLAPRYRH